jgi:S1-C subfamily serine protease
MKKQKLAIFTWVISIVLVWLWIYDPVSAPITSRYQVWRIIGSYPSLSGSIVRGMGTILPTWQILTSAHIVSDPRLIYTFSVDGMSQSSVRMSTIDPLSDRALMVTDLSLNWDMIGWVVYPFAPTHTGDVITAQVIRSWALITLTGQVVSPSGQIIGYKRDGRTEMISGIVITDLSVIPGDSGAPIYDRRGELIDIVHARGEK